MSDLGLSQETLDWYRQEEYDYLQDFSKVVKGTGTFLTADG
jgi:hypothetical protein